MENEPYTLSSILLKSLLCKESKNVKYNSNNLLKVNLLDRDSQVQWLCDAGRHLNLGLNTIGLAITILDRVLCLVVVKAK